MPLVAVGDAQLHVGLAEHVARMRIELESDEGERLGVGAGVGAGAAGGVAGGVVLLVVLTGTVHCCAAPVLQGSMLMTLPLLELPSWLFKQRPEALLTMLLSALTVHCWVVRLALQL